MEGACFGVAGPVMGDSAWMTNVPWQVDGKAVALALGLGRVHLLNDLVSIAHSVSVLQPDEMHVLQEGQANLAGNAAVIAAGTGLGQVYLHRINGRLLPVASEGGHADFAPRTDREFEFARMLRALYGRAEVEQVLSGPGLVNLHRFTHRAGLCARSMDLLQREMPAAMSPKRRFR